MALELGDVVATFGRGKVLVEQAVDIEVPRDWTVLWTFELTEWCYVGVEATVNNPPKTWSTYGPALAVGSNDESDPVPGKNYVRAEASRASGLGSFHLCVFGKLEPGEYEVRAGTQVAGRVINISHLAVTVLPV